MVMYRFGRPSLNKGTVLKYKFSNSRYGVATREYRFPFPQQYTYIQPLCISVYQKCSSSTLFKSFQFV